MSHPTHPTLALATTAVAALTALTAAASLVACTDHSRGTEECTSDRQCGTDYVCSAGECAPADGAIVDRDGGARDTASGGDGSPSDFVTSDGQCIEVRPADVIELADVVVGETEEMQVEIESCGSAPLTVADIALTSATSGSIALSGLPTDIANGTATTVHPGNVHQITVECTPTQARTDTGTLVIESDDPDDGRIEVPIVCTGRVNRCPEVVALGRVRDSGDPLSENVAAAPLDHIALTTEGTLDPDGDEIVAYRWSVVEAPAGFSLGFVPNAIGPETEIQVPQLGDYVFEATAVDEYGLEACEPARVQVRTASQGSLHVELTWRTPSDPDETDTGPGAGTDLDLHLLNGNENAFWNDSMGTESSGIGTDCYSGNVAPNWGGPGSDDDCSLQRNDTDGGGPESLSIESPAYTDGSQVDGYSLPYLLGVYFYDHPPDIGPPVYARVRIFIGDAPTAAADWPTEGDGRELNNADPLSEMGGDFWLAGEIHWNANGGTPLPIDTAYSGLPDGRR